MGTGVSNPCDIHVINEYFQVHVILHQRTPNNDCANICRWMVRIPLPKQLIESLSNNDACAVQICPLLGISKQSRWYWQQSLGYYIPDDIPNLEPICDRLETLQLDIPPYMREFEVIARLLAKSIRLRDLSLATILHPNLERSHPNTNFGWLYDALGVKDRILKLRSLRLLYFCACKEADQLRWRNIVHWETLETAEFTCPFFLTCALGRPLRLKSLTLNLDAKVDSVEQVLNFRNNLCSSILDESTLKGLLRSIPNLHELYLKNGTFSIDQSVLTHHKELRRLELVKDLNLLKETESSFGSGIFSSIQTHCGYLESLRIHLLPDEVLPCLNHIVNYGSPSPNLTMDFGVPTDDPDIEESRSPNGDADSCLEIFRNIINFTATMAPENKPLDCNLTVSVCVSLPGERRTTIWAILERQFRIATVIGGNSLRIIVHCISQDSSISGEREAAEIYCLLPNPVLDAEFVQVTRIGVVEHGHGGLMWRIID